MSYADNNQYQQQIFAHWDLLNRLVRKHFSARNSEKISDLADEALLYVLQKLEEEDWSRVRQYRGLSSFQTFLRQVTQRLLTDFWRHKYGRSRIPTWIEARGPLWVRVYRQLCRERLPATGVVEGLQTELGDAGDPAVLWEIVAAIRARIIDCGAPPSHKIETTFSDGPDSCDMGALADHLVPAPSAEDLVAAERRVHLLKAVAELLMPEGATAEPALASDDALPAAALRRLRETLAFTPEERLLLKLVYREGLPATEAGHRLGLNSHQTHGRLRRLLERIRSTLHAVGLDRVLVEWLEDTES